MISFENSGLGLGMGLLVLFLATWGVLLCIQKLGGVNKKAMSVLFLIAVFTHLAAASFIHYAEFYPLGTGSGEGDQGLFHLSSSAIAQDFRQGDFSIGTIKKNITGFSLTQGYPVVIGGLYALTVPDQFVGKAFNVWLMAMSILFVYLIAVEIGASSRQALIAGLLANLYPSFLYFGSLLNREAPVAAVFLLSLLLTLRMVKRFSFSSFLLFSFAVFALIHLRFYVGFVALFIFPFSFLVFSNLTWRQKLKYGVVIIPLLGFVPQLLGHGYYASSTIRIHIQPERIEMYRDHAYTVLADVDNPGVGKNLEGASPGSTVVVKAEVDNPASFTKNYITSFLFVSMGPLPWHLKESRHLFSLGETIPWFILVLCMLGGVWRERRRYRVILPIVFAAVGLLVALALLIDNFGIYMRLRMPAFLALFSLAYSHNR